MGMVPSSTSSSPATMRRAVVLPQPDGPSSTRSSPSSTVRGQVVDGHDVAEALGDPVETTCAIGRDRTTRRSVSDDRTMTGRSGAARMGGGNGRARSARLARASLAAGGGQCAPAGDRRHCPRYRAGHRATGSLPPRRSVGRIVVGIDESEPSKAGRGLGAGRSPPASGDARGDLRLRASPSAGWAWARPSGRPCRWPSPRATWPPTPSRRSTPCWPTRPTDGTAEGPASRPSGAPVPGHAAQVLVAASADADLLVVGSRGHGDVRQPLLGSVAAALRPPRPCPVVVVPASPGRTGRRAPSLRARDVLAAAAGRHLGPRPRRRGLAHRRAHRRRRPRRSPGCAGPASGPSSPPTTPSSTVAQLRRATGSGRHRRRSPRTSVTSAQAAAAMLAPGEHRPVLAGPGVAEALGGPGRHGGRRRAGRRGGGRVDPNQFDFDRLTAGGHRRAGRGPAHRHQRGRHLPDPRRTPARRRLAAGRGGHRLGGHPRGGRQAARSRWSTWSGSGPADVVAVVGDRPSTDGQLADRLGVPFALVLSGVTRPGQPAAGHAGRRRRPRPGEHLVP